MISKMAYLVQLVGGPKNRALPSGQGKMQHNAQLVCLAAVLPLPCSFKDSTCKCTAPSQLPVKVTFPLHGMVLVCVDAAHTRAWSLHSGVAIHVVTNDNSAQCGCEAASLIASKQGQNWLRSDQIGD